ncbi:uncharacterized protein PGTG_03933 [Puccinia graminis f. sp. tritici CRL 75-36-700-3]|uniref:Fe2OG dioxygenase domain-containing protein n=1 Tax=Puccinia graminis f. sp. tritici (strain CRL 75-36-700-3 / race SCCL) TaxID=418459 RepID=E3K102_PUCGT|nr:uncharacterized protein PGTG_03933 [Puccinia graminis f. sp. tritici CRL 75-36-700-3]EFP77977.1 hypothetical protein PGTG_03933 [Puccinia graminis f. sp. tritici CRL 75-36-700-3]
MPKDFPSTPSIPLIDFSAFSNPDAGVDEQVLVANRLLEGFKKNGFVYLQKVSVSPEMVSEAFGWSKKFFDLPVEIKKQALHPADGSCHRGYSPIGLEKVKPIEPSNGRTMNGNEKAAAPDHKETYDIGKPGRLSEHNIWLPEESERKYDLTGFRKFFEEFYEACERLEMGILRAISIGLMGIEEADYLSKFHQESNNQIRLAHYPPIEATQLIEGVRERFGAHTDFGSITILFQDQVGGLQVENPTAPGHFLQVKPIEETVVVNIADLLMRWSNDTLRSTLHRVGPPDVTGLIPSRYSIPYFCGPDPKALIKCLPGSTSEPKYEPIYADEYIKMRMKSSY